MREREKKRLHLWIMNTKKLAKSWKHEFKFFFQYNKNYAQSLKTFFVNKKDLEKCVFIGAWSLIWTILLHFNCPEEEVLLYF